MREVILQNRLKLNTKRKTVQGYETKKAFTQKKLPQNLENVNGYHELFL